MALKLKRTSRSDELPDPLESVRRAWNHAQALDTALRELHEILLSTLEDLEGSGFDVEFRYLPSELAQAIVVLDELGREIAYAEDALESARRMVVEPEASS